MISREEGRHAARIARIELRRGWRSAVDRWTLVGVGLGLCLFGGWTLFLGGIGYLLGSFSGNESVVLTDSTGGQLVGWVVFLAGLIAIQTVENRARIDNEDLLFTTVSPRTVLLGLLGTELARQSFFFGSFVVAASVGFALGAGAPTLVPVVVLVSLPVLLLVVLLGHVTGVAAKLLTSRVSGFGWLRTAAGLVIGALIGLTPILVVSGSGTFGLSLDIASLLAVVLPALGVLFSGAAFGLNPLGDERKALPAVLSMPGGGRFVRARVLAGLPWTALALSGVALGGVVGRFEPGTAILLAVLVVSLCVLSATVAPVFGIAFPRFEPVAATKSEVITPSFGAIVGHAGAVGAAGAAGLLILYVPTVLGALSGSTPSFASRAGLMCAVAGVVLGASYAAYRHAVGRFQAATVS